MLGFKVKHWIAVASTLGIVVLLLFAPHHTGKFDSEEAVVEAEQVPDVEYRIDSALKIIQGAAPMQGILLLREVADENPGNFRAQYHLGRFSAQTGQWEKVIERFDAVKRIDPQFVEANYWLGLANFQLGNSEKALTFLEEFLSKEKDNIELISDAQTMFNQLI